MFCWRFILVVKEDYIKIPYLKFSLKIIHITKRTLCREKKVQSHTHTHALVHFFFQGRQEIKFSLKIFVFSWDMWVKIHWELNLWLIVYKTMCVYVYLLVTFWFLSIYFAIIYVLWKLIYFSFCHVTKIFFPTAKNKIKADIRGIEMFIFLTSFHSFLLFFQPQSPPPLDKHKHTHALSFHLKEKLLPVFGF